MKALLNNNKHTEYCAPVTSFDWNVSDPSIIGACSIDTTCTIWDIEVTVCPLNTHNVHPHHVHEVVPLHATSYLFTCDGP